MIDDDAEQTGVPARKKRTMREKREPRPLGIDTTVSPMVQQFDKELLKIKRINMAKEEAQTVVRKYFDIQRMRVAMQLTRIADEKAGKPTDIVSYIGDNLEIIEKELSRLLIPYANTQPIGEWMLQHKGIGGVIAAGFLAEIDIEKCPTAGHLMSYAGLVPGQRLVRGEKRSWNGQLKLLCHYAGESFAKQVNREDAYYGQVLKWAKMLEWKRNLAGELAGEAARSLAEKNYGKDTSAYAWYTGQYADADFTGTYINGKKCADPDDKVRSHVEYFKDGHNQHDVVHTTIEHPRGGVPMLPPAHIARRAKRRAVKMFLHHVHFVWYTMHFGVQPPLPYPIQHMGHADFFPPPNWQVRGIPVASAPWLKARLQTLPTGDDLSTAAEIAHLHDTVRKEE